MSIDNVNNNSRTGLYTAGAALIGGGAGVAGLVAYLATRKSTEA